MKTEVENNGSGKLTLFKPPGYIYKLSKSQAKNTQKQQYETYYNSEHSLRKYSRTLNISSQSQLLLYEWRKQSSSPIVKVVYLELVKRTISSSTPDSSWIDVKVYTENIEKVLADMINLTLTEAIYVLKQCVLAYQELFSKFSAVSINKFYIGLNAQGKFKVWINENFSLNSVSNQPTELETLNAEVLISQTAIVSKIIHMINLLANTSCKHFFYGLEKSLSIKKFSFNNSLQYINNFVTNTKNIQIPTNLIYMLPKKSSFCLDRSNVNFIGSTRMRKNQNQRKQTTFSNLQCTNSFKHFGSVVRLPNRKNTQNQSLMESMKQNKLKFKRYSEQLPNNIFSTLPLTKINHSNSLVVEKETTNPKQYKVSLQVIMEKSRRNSVKSNEILVARKSNISIQKQRPSICVPPTFLTNSTIRNGMKQKTRDNKQNLKDQNEAEQSNKSYSLQSSKSRGYQSIVNSKVGSSRLGKFGQTSRVDVGKQQVEHPSRNTKYETEVSLYFNTNKQVSNVNLRARSASANIKFGPSRIPEFMLDSTRQKPQQSSIIQTVKSDHRESLEKSKIYGDKTSNNSISNSGTTRKRSFLTKTNYDSNAEDNDKNFSSSRMDFSSMSIQNRITNKNFDLDLTNSRKEETKRSLIAFKYGFEQIMENPSCKEVEQENETKSYNGSSLKNTQNIEEKLSKINKKNEETASNNYSFGNNSNKLTRRKHLNDSMEENWDKIKERNEEALMKNQWKKTINNLNQLEDLALNQSIVDACDQIVQRDPYPDIRLDKLDRLGKNMCYSIVKKSDDTFEIGKLASAKLKSQFYQIF